MVYHTRQQNLICQVLQAIISLYSPSSLKYCCFSLSGLLYRISLSYTSLPFLWSWKRISASPFNSVFSFPDSVRRGAPAPGLPNWWWKSPYSSSSCHSKCVCQCHACFKKNDFDWVFFSVARQMQFLHKNEIYLCKSCKKKKKLYIFFDDFVFSIVFQFLPLSAWAQGLLGYCVKGHLQISASCVAHPQQPARNMDHKILYHCKGGVMSLL